MTSGGKDRQLGRWEAMPLCYFQGWHRILQDNLLMRHSVSSPACASDSGAGCPHTVGPGLVLWDGGCGTSVTLLWQCSGSSVAKLAQGVRLFPAFGHAEQGLALLSWGLSNFGIKPLVFHGLPPSLFLPSHHAKPRGLKGCLGAGGPSLDTRHEDVGAGAGAGSEADGQWGEPVRSCSHPTMCQSPCCTHRTECPGRHVFFVDLAPTGSHPLGTAQGDP